MAKLIGSTVLWAGGTATGAAGKSIAAYVGAADNLALYMKNSDGSTSTTITIEVAYNEGNPGRNADVGAADWHTLLKADGTGNLAITLAAGASLAVNIAPFAPSFVRLSSSADVDVRAIAEYQT